MLQAAYARRVIKRAKDVDRSRRELQALSSEILSASKRAIFAFHRDDIAAGEAEIGAARAKLAKGRKIVAIEPRVTYEGAWRAAQEEFAEASLFSQYLANHRIGPVREVSDDPDVFLGGVSDLTGELTRRAVMQASLRQQKEVERLYRDVSAVVDFLLQMDLTGSLRTKVDQAKQNLRKLEEIRYDLSIHVRS